MKRFHVHAHVDNLAQSVAFYSRLFGAEPVRLEVDYAKWLIEDPRLNFAISSRGHAPGIDHLGIQADTEEELAELKARAQAADAPVRDEGATTCCYARSDKHWVTDPQGIAWEHYRTLESIPVFREAVTEASTGANAGTACCGPSAAVNGAAASVAAPAVTARGKPIGIAVRGAGSSCC